MHRERLARAATELDKWGKSKSKLQFDMESYYVKDPECGTSCCAAGYLGTLSWFRKEGLKTNKEYNDIHFGELTDMRALEAFFELPYQHDKNWDLMDTGPDERGIEGLFYDFDLTEPQQVAARIRKLLKEKTS